MDTDPNPSDEQLIAEIETFLGSPRADTARARRIAARMPVSFAALREGAAACSPPPVKGAFAISALALGTLASAAIIVFASLKWGSPEAPQQPAPTGAPEIAVVEEDPEPHAPKLALEPVARAVPGEPSLSDRAPARPAVIGPQELVTSPPGPEPEIAAVPKEEPLWSFLPRADPEPPSVDNRSWQANAIDQFVLAKIEAAGVQPAQDAPPAALLRRLHYDLTGLPPTADEVERFVGDPSYARYVEVVDDLLARWQFGEKQARHWLDLAGYDAGVKHAWRYREYVIAAFNKDKPFNWFLAEQIAGDQLDTGDTLRRAEAQVATAFLAMGKLDMDEEDVAQRRMDQIDGQIDLVTRTFLGLSVSCARCHDHKFDPVSQRDYYALAGIFNSTDTRGGYKIRERFDLPPVAAVPVMPFARNTPSHLIELDTAHLGSSIGVTDRHQQEAEIKQLSAQAESYQRRILTARNRGDSERLVRLQASLRTVTTRLGMLQNLDFSKLNHSGSRAIGLCEGEVADCALRIDGDVGRLGSVVPRGFPGALNFPGGEIPIPRDTSGRLELAKWLLAEDNPLTARVFVNRVWAQLLGRGIVRSVDDFGANGIEPTHPQLLDYLAKRFIEGKWSMKWLVREIVLSRTYRLDSVAGESLLEADPENDLFARRELRPLTAEELRDSMIAAAGLLSGESAAVRDQHRYLASAEFTALSSFVDGDAFPLSSPFRTVYLPIKVQAPGMLALFDGPEPGARTADRAETTSAPQALFMMNNEFVYQASMEAAFAIRDRKSAARPEQIVPEIFLSLLGRRPTADELAATLEYLAGISIGDDVHSPGIADVSDPLSAWIARTGLVLPTAEPETVSGRQLERVIPWTMLYHGLMQTAEYRFLR